MSGTDLDALLDAIADLESDDPFPWVDAARWSPSLSDPDPDLDPDPDWIDGLPPYPAYTDEYLREPPPPVPLPRRRRRVS